MLVLKDRARVSPCFIRCHTLRPQSVAPAASVAWAHAAHTTQAPKATSPQVRARAAFPIGTSWGPGRRQELSLRGYTCVASGLGLCKPSKAFTALPWWPSALSVQPQGARRHVDPGRPGPPGSPEPPDPRGALQVTLYTCITTRIGKGADDPRSGIEEERDVGTVALRQPHPAPDRVASTPL